MYIVFQTVLIILALILVVGGGAYAYFDLVESRRRINRYFDRPRTECAWRTEFPYATEIEIQDFLGALVRAFNFDDKKPFQFHPCDKLFDIYRALYPIPGTPDGCELEFFIQALDDTYRTNLESVWSTELTLGEIFGAVLTASDKSMPRRKTSHASPCA